MRIAEKFIIILYTFTHCIYVQYIHIIQLYTQALSNIIIMGAEKLRGCKRNVVFMKLGQCGANCNGTNIISGEIPCARVIRINIYNVQC